MSSFGENPTARRRRSQKVAGGKRSAASGCVVTRIRALKGRKNLRASSMRQQSPTHVPDVARLATFSLPLRGINNSFKQRINDYSRTLTTLLLLLFVCAFAPSHAAAHTFHTSLMHMEYNRTEQLVEISLQVFTHDLENILTRRAGKSVRIDKTPDATQLTFAYLQETINLKNGAGETKTLTWVGMETKSDRAWLYFEAKMPEGLQGAQLRNRLFFDLLDDQVNLVHLKDAERKRDLVFKPGDSFKPLFEALGKMSDGKTGIAG